VLSLTVLAFVLAEFIICGFFRGKTLPTETAMAR
jgi:hypothetical protein